MGILRDLMDARWGVHLVPEFNPKIYAITANEQKVLNDHADRLTILFLNLGNQVCYLHTTKEVSSSLGIYLDKNGGGIEMTWEVYGELVGQEWWCEGAGATNLYVVSLVGAGKILERV